MVCVYNGKKVWEEMFFKWDIDHLRDISRHYHIIEYDTKCNIMLLQDNTSGQVQNNYKEPFQYEENPHWWCYPLNKTDNISPPGAGYS